MHSPLDLFSMQFTYDVQCTFFGYNEFTREHCAEILKGIKLVCCGMTDRLLVPLEMDPYKFNFAAVILENGTKKVNVVGLSVIFTSSTLYRCKSRTIQISDCVRNEFQSFSFHSAAVDKSNESYLLWNVMEKITLDRFDMQTRDYTCAGLIAEIPFTDLHDAAEKRIELALRAMYSDDALMTMLVPLGKSRDVWEGDAVPYACLINNSSATYFGRMRMEKHFSVQLFTIGATDVVSKINMVWGRKQAIKIHRSYGHFPDVHINAECAYHSYHVRPGYFFKPIASYYSETIRGLEETFLLAKGMALTMALHKRLGSKSPIHEIGEDNMELIVRLFLQ